MGYDTNDDALEFGVAGPGFKNIPGAHSRENAVITGASLASLPPGSGAARGLFGWWVGLRLDELRARRRDLRPGGDRKKFHRRDRSARVIDEGVSSDREAQRGEAPAVDGMPRGKKRRITRVGFRGVPSHITLGHLRWLIQRENRAEVPSRPEQKPPPAKGEQAGGAREKWWMRRSVLRRSCEKRAAAKRGSRPARNGRGTASCIHC
jgi:hypothetical protein